MVMKKPNPEAMKLLEPFCGIVLFILDLPASAVFGPHRDFGKKWTADEKTSRAGKARAAGPCPLDSRGGVVDELGQITRPLYRRSSRRIYAKAPRRENDIARDTEVAGHGRKRRENHLMVSQSPLFVGFRTKDQVEVPARSDFGVVEPAAVERLAVESRRLDIDILR